MTTSKTPGIPPSDEELEARLRGSWGRSVARAEDDLARGDLVPSAMAAGRRRQPRRMAGGAMLGVAAILVVGFALVVGSGARREPVEPPASPAPEPVGSLATPGSPAPDASIAPGAGEGTPVLGPGVTFPPAVDGQPVVTVGPEADASIAAATDDSPIYVSGWILGPDRRGCADFDSGSPAPNGVMWKECTAIPLRATEDGGATLPVHVSYADEARFPRMPDVTHVLPVLMKVHVHDAGCAADCSHKPVLDAVLQYGAPLIAPVLRVATRPSGGITMEQALAAADAYIQQNLTGYGLPLVLLSAEAGPRALVGQGGSMSELDWVWAMRYVSEPGSTECTVYVDYLGGDSHESSCESVSFP